MSMIRKARSKNPASNSLHANLIKLGTSNPALRPHIRQILSAVDDRVYRDLLSISSGSLRSLLNLGPNYVEISKAHHDLLDFARSSPKRFTDWRDVVDAFRKVRKASRRCASWCRECGGPTLGDGDYVCDGCL
jgi:hypothetical protein